MNGFMENADILGRNEAMAMNENLAELFRLARDIQSRLGGRKRRLLDRYLSQLLAGAGATMAYDAAERGLMALSELRGLCREAMLEGNGDRLSGHPLAAKVRECVAEASLSGREEYARIQLCLAALFADFSEYAAERYFTLKSAELSGRCDFTETANIRREICAELGSEEDMERFDALFRQRFLLVPAMALFLQGMTCGLIDILTHRDNGEESRQVFELLLDSIETEAEE